MPGAGWPGPAPGTSPRARQQPSVTRNSLSGSISMPKDLFRQRSLAAQSGRVHLREIAVASADGRQTLAASVPRPVMLPMSRRGPVPYRRSKPGSV
jgi:hypothetical protein